MLWCWVCPALESLALDESRPSGEDPHGEEVFEGYHFILANPPYIAESKKSKIQASVIENEPPKALFGGKDGLLYITRFVKDAKKYLKKEGKIYMEFDSFQKGAIDNLLKALEHKAWNFYKDQYGNWRYVVISL